MAIGLARTASGPIAPGAPLVSVVVIFLDAERFITEAIESVLAQTYPHWELLLVDDGSSDGSTATARTFAATHPERIRYLAHPGHRNRGMSASRNLGIHHASGELVAFLDADDVWLPHKLSRQVAALRDHPDAAMVYGPTRLWYSWTGRDEDRHRDRPRLLGVAADTLVPPPVLAARYLSGSALTPATCGVLVRRSAIGSIGGFETSFRGMFEDQVFFYKIALRHPIFVQGDTGDLYRQHDASHWHAAERAGIYRYDRPNAAELAFLEWLSAYLRDIGEADPRVRHALRRRFHVYRHPSVHRAAAMLGRVRASVHRAAGRAAPRR